MKTKAIALMIFVMASCILGGWTNTSNTITNFYYYKNQPFELNLKKDILFVKMKNAVPESRFRAIVSELSLVATVNKFVNNDKAQFINLNATVDEAGLISACSRIMLNNDVEYCSPVFSPDGGTTLIGVENEIIVQFRPSMTQDQINSALSSRNLTIGKNLTLMGGSSYILKVAQNEFAIDKANELFTSGLVNWSEPNLYFTNLICYTPNDIYYPMQWSLVNTGSNIPVSGTGTPGCDMRVDSAWNITLGISNCKISVSDTGIDTLHEDLSANILHGLGYDYYNNDPWPMDDMGHGTCCAGEIAAVGNNSLGISGVAPNCKLIPMKWLSSTGNGNYAGATSATILSYQVGAWIISNSWGFVGGASSALDQAILDAVTLGRNGKGTLFVVAAGNENSAAMRYPANTNPNVLVVGGISPCNQRKSFGTCDGESWGASYGTNLNVVAPCVKVYTTDITGSPGFTSTNYDNAFNGTSSATPNTAGVCALGMSKDSTLKWDSVRVKISRTCDKVGAYVYATTGPLAALGFTWNLEMGYGKVNAYQFLTSLTITGVNNNTETSNSFSLSQNYPNPFNPTTVINFTLPKDGNVLLKVYDGTGKEVAVLADGFKKAGAYDINFDGTNLSSGVYFYKIEAGDFSSIRKMILIK